MQPNPSSSLTQTPSQPWDWKTRGSIQVCAGLRKKRLSVPSAKACPCQSLYVLLTLPPSIYLHLSTYLPRCCSRTYRHDPSSDASSRLETAFASASASPLCYSSHDASGMPAIESTRAATRWTTLIVPVFIAAAVAFATYVVVARVCCTLSLCITIHSIVLVSQCPDTSPPRRLQTLWQPGSRSSATLMTGFYPQLITYFTRCTMMALPLLFSSFTSSSLC